MGRKEDRAMRNFLKRIQLKHVIRCREGIALIYLTGLARQMSQGIRVISHLPIGLCWDRSIIKGSLVLRICKI